MPICILMLICILMIICILMLMLPLWLSLPLHPWHCSYLSPCIYGISLISPPLTSMQNGISPWGCSPCLPASLLSLCLHVFVISLLLFDHGKKDNSPCQCVSSCLYATDIPCWIYFSYDFSSLDLSARCCVDQCRDTCKCFLSSLPVLVNCPLVLPLVNIWHM